MKKQRKHFNGKFKKKTNVSLVSAAKIQKKKVNRIEKQYLNKKYLQLKIDKFKPLQHLNNVATLQWIVVFFCYIDCIGKCVSCSLKNKNTSEKKL